MLRRGEALLMRKTKIVRSGASREPALAGQTNVLDLYPPAVKYRSFTLMAGCQKDPSIGAHHGIGDQHLHD